MGRTQAEKRYILDTVLEHLPLVTGSERDMNVYVIQKNGHNSSSSCDEFGYSTNNLVDSYGDKSRKRGWLRIQDEYILVVNGSFRDREFVQTLREFNKWICRLAKRISMEDMLVEIKGYGEKILVRNDNDVYGKMFKNPSWSDEGSENWCEYLMWDYERNEDGDLLVGKPLKNNIKQ
jgi:hypothetical protein